MKAKNRNLTWHHSTITQKDREKKNRHRGVVVWLTGLPSSGKSTIAVGLEQELFKKGCNVFVLDGDNVRHGLNSDLGFSERAREENIRRIGEVAKLFMEAGFIAITAFISPYRRDRDKARFILPEGAFMELYIKASLETCEKRDTKGLYRKARSGELKEFTGISAPYEEPLNAELVVDTESMTEQESVRFILDHLKAKRVFL